MKSQIKDPRYRRAAVSRGQPYPLESEGRSERRRVRRDPTEQQRIFSSQGTPMTFAPLLAMALPLLKGALTAGATALGTAAVKGIADGVTRRTQQWAENKRGSMNAQQKKGGEAVQYAGDLLANKLSGGSGGVEGATRDWVMNVGRKKPAPKAEPMDVKPTPPPPKPVPTPDPQAPQNPTPPMQTSGPTAIGQMPTGRPVSRRPPPMYDDDYMPQYRPMRRRSYDDYPRRRYYNDYEDFEEVRGPRYSNYEY
jgi:hypothetical protein